MDNISAYSSVAAAAIAAITLFWTYNRWQNERKRDILSKFRSDLSNFRTQIEQYRNDINDLVAIEVGNYSAQRFFEICYADKKNTVTGVDVAKNLKEVDLTEVILGPLLYGYKNSEIHGRLMSSVVSMQEIGSSYNELFPITNRFLDVIARYRRVTVDPNSIARAISQSLKSEEDSVVETLINNISDNDDYTNLFSKMSDFFTSVVANGNHIALPAAVHVHSIVSAVVEEYLAKTDRSLEEASRHEIRSLSSVVEVDTYTGDIINMTNALQKNVSSDGWTKIVTARTELDTHFK